MSKIILVKPTKQHEAAALEYVEEHFSVGEHDLHGSSLLEKLDSYNDWLEHLERQSHPATVPAGRVVSTTMFAVRESDSKIVGIIDIRHTLNDFLASYAGHIGYGVRPTERRRGYATQMLKQGVQFCRSIGLAKVMVSCHKNNIGSGKTIVKNGGVLEREFIYSDGEEVQVYWITL